MARIFTVHARPATRLAVARAILAAPGLEIVAQTTSAAEARRVLGAIRPDAMTVDARLPNDDGIALAEELRAANPGLGVVVLGPSRDRELVLRALMAGLSAYMPESAAATELAAAIRQAATSTNTFSSRCLAAALRHSRRRTQSAALSAREEEVLRLVREGMGLGAIAGQLLLSESTVKTYLARVQAKLRIDAQELRRPATPRP